MLFLGCSTAYAFFQVPYVAMPAEMTDSPDERTRLMTWRVAVLALAILVSGGVAPAIRDGAGYAAMGVFVAALIAVGATAAWRGTRDAPAGAVTAASGTLREQLAVVGADRDFRALLAAFVVQSLGVGAMLAGVDYVARDVLERDGAGSILFACFIAPALLCTPLWQRLGQRTGKLRGFVVASLVLAAGAAGLLAVRHLPAVVVYLAGAVAGIGYAGHQLFPLSMLPDVAAADAARTGASRVGVFTGIWTAGETLGLALGPALYGLVLALGGYVSGADGAAVQPDSAVTAIALGFSVVPAALILGSLGLLRGYRLRT